jgi:hypothetical protein
VATVDVPVVVNVSTVATLDKVVPFVAFVKVTLAPVTKPVPVTVTGVPDVVGAARSTRPVGLTEVNEGSALTVIKPVSVTVPLSSTYVTL